MAESIKMWTGWDQPILEKLLNATHIDLEDLQINIDIPESPYLNKNVETSIFFTINNDAEAELVI
jgi:hypothetical protein